MTGESGPSSVSQAVLVDSDETFENTTFALKRTRSLGVLDEFSVRPSQEFVGSKEDYPHLVAADGHHSDDGENDGGRDGDAFAGTARDDEDDYFSHRNAANSQYYEHGDDYDEAPISPVDSPEPLVPNDDTAVKREPSKRVDYFTHDWNESDISASWRYIVLRRKDVANSARLENASWRSWTKAKYNLKTVAPESVNWLKDSDVTWLYGPIYDEPAHTAAAAVASGAGPGSPSFEPSTGHNPATSGPQKGGRRMSTNETSSTGPTTKPILKKKSVSQMMLSGISSSSASHSHHDADPHGRGQGYKTQATDNSPAGGEAPPKAAGETGASPDATDIYLRHHNYRHRPRTGGHSNEDISRYINRQYRHVPGHLFNSTAANVKSPGSQLSEVPSSSSASSLSINSAPIGRHIHFNDRVEQCRVVEFSDSSSESEDEGDDGPSGNVKNNVDNRRHHVEDDDDDDEDEDGGSSDEDEEEAGLFLMVRSSSSASLHKKGNLGSLSAPSAVAGSGGSTGTGGRNSPANNQSHYQTIELLPATTLKYDYDDLEREARARDQAHSVAYAMSHNTANRRHAYKTYDYNSVYQSPTSTPHSSPKDSSSESLNNDFGWRGGAIVAGGSNPVVCPTGTAAAVAESRVPDEDYIGFKAGSGYSGYDRTPSQIVDDRGSAVIAASLAHSSSVSASSPSQAVDDSAPTTPPPLSPSSGVLNTHTTTEYAQGQFGGVRTEDNRSAASNLLMDQQASSEFVENVAEPEPEFANAPGSDSSGPVNSATSATSANSAISATSSTNSTGSTSSADGVKASAALAAAKAAAAATASKTSSEDEDADGRLNNHDRAHHSKLNVAKGFASMFRGSWKK